MRRAILSGLAVLALCACDSPTVPVESVADGYEDCSSGGGATFVVKVVDINTGKSLAAAATGEWVAGLSRGTLMPDLPKFPYHLGGEYLLGPFGRPGRYSVTVTTAGYALWRGSVAVQQGTGHCDVVFAGDVLARLAPLR